MNLQSSLKSTSMWRRQNRRSRPQVVAGKHGLSMPWNTLAIALPLNMTSWWSPTIVRISRDIVSHLLCETTVSILFGDRLVKNCSILDGSHSKYSLILDRKLQSSCFVTSFREGWIAPSAELLSILYSESSCKIWRFSWLFTMSWRIEQTWSRSSFDKSPINEMKFHQDFPYPKWPSRTSMVGRIGYPLQRKQINKCQPQM